MRGRITRSSWLVVGVLLVLLGPVALASAPTPIKDIAPGSPGSFPDHLLTFDGAVFFTATEPETGTELWKSDGSSDNTALVVDAEPGATSSYPFELTTSGGRLFFTASHPEQGRELWAMDGSATDAGVVLDINPGGNADPTDLTDAGGNLYFTAFHPSYGNELWTSDGTPAGTRLVKDIRPGTTGAGTQGPTEIEAIGDQLFFAASDGPHGLELWTSDGSADGTRMVKDINAARGSALYGITPLGDEVYFAADDGVHGFELWKSDGTETGTVMVADIQPGGEESDPLSFTKLGGLMFFTATDGTWGRELWRSNGTESGTFMVKDISAGEGGGSPLYLENIGGTLYFAASDSNCAINTDPINEPCGKPVPHGYELWTSDGTADGTVMVKDIRPGADDSTPLDFTLLGGRAYFSAVDNPAGRELWVSDGTAAGTVRVADIDPLTAASCCPAGSARPRSLTVLGAALLFGASDGVKGEEPWELVP